MLKLKPSSRENKRYLLIKGTKKNVENAILEFIGVLGWARASPIFVSEFVDEVVLCVNNKSLNEVKAAFALAKDELKVLRISGTLKGLNR